MPTFSFRFPGLPESDATLSQAPVVRSVSWLLYITTIVGALISIATMVESSATSPPAFSH